MSRFDNEPSFRGARLCANPESRSDYIKISGSRAERAPLTAANRGDPPIQVGSHYHFFETNPALKFDRKKARGMRLDIAAGTAVRFEPGPPGRGNPVGP